MARPTSQFLELVRKGAAHRYRELKTELAALVNAFPHLGSAVSPAMPDEAVKPGRNRRTMSAAARKKISEAQKRRWAERKGGKK